MVNLYRYTWKKLLNMLDPLVKRLGGKHQWIYLCMLNKRNLNRLKNIITKETVLLFPKLNVPFDIHTDASDFQLGWVVFQGNKPVALFTEI